MAFIEKKSENIVLLHVFVKPNSKMLNIIEDGDYLHVSLRSKPVKNKANKELINILKKKLNLSSNQIQIISGLKSKNKVIEILFDKEFDEQQMVECLKS
jgi:hypothetical protein